MRRTAFKSKPKPRQPKEITDHWARVRALGCVVTRKTRDVTIHHVHSGSIAEIGVGRQKWKANDYLVIPLDLALHSLGPEAIDGAKGVLSWEAEYGRQVDHVDWVCRQLGVNVWKLAGVEREVEGL